MSESIQFGIQHAAPKSAADPNAPSGASIAASVMEVRGFGAAVDNSEIPN